MPDGLSPVITEPPEREAAPAAGRRVFIKTHGCQMNVYDSGRMGDALAAAGYRATERAEDADLIILNTCHIREKAAEKVFSELGRFKQVKEARAQRGHRTLLAVAGCVAQAQGAEIARRARHVDLVFGPQTYHRLPDLVCRAEHRRDGMAVVDTDFPVEDKFDLLPESRAPAGISAFLSVQEGCDKFCSFCVVPYTRGAERSRPVMDIVAEAGRLVARGAREITLLGQNVNAYHGSDERGRECGLAGLLERLAAVPGILRLRYTTSHPRDMDDALIRAHGDIPQLMPYLHLPVQSGSDRVLAAMNRRHSADDYRRIVDRLRSVRPDIALSSDFIVGFPGERDGDFAATMALVAEIGFAASYSFKFSPRPGTPAADVDDPTSEAVKNERLAALQERLAAQQDDFNRDMIGRQLAVLFTGRGRAPGQIVGRSPYLQPVHLIAGPELIGETVMCTITDAKAHSLFACPVDTAAVGAAANTAANAPVNTAATMPAGEG